MRLVTGLVLACFLLAFCDARPSQKVAKILARLAKGRFDDDNGGPPRPPPPRPPGMGESGESSSESGESSAESESSSISSSSSSSSSASEWLDGGWDIFGEGYKETQLAKMLARLAKGRFDDDNGGPPRPPPIAWESPIPYPGNSGENNEPSPPIHIDPPPPPPPGMGESGESAESGELSREGESESSSMFYTIY